MKQGDGRRGVGLLQGCVMELVGKEESMNLCRNTQENGGWAEESRGTTSREVSLLGKRALAWLCPGPWLAQEQRGARTLYLRPKKGACECMLWRQKDEQNILGQNIFLWTRSPKSGKTGVVRFVRAKRRFGQAKRRNNSATSKHYHKNFTLCLVATIVWTYVHPLVPHRQSFPAYSHCLLT